MSPKEAVIRYIERFGVRTNIKGDVNSDTAFFTSKELMIGRRAVLINMIIGHYGIHCNDADGNKLKLGYEDPRFFDRLENLLIAGVTTAP